MTQETEFLKAQQQFQRLCDLMRQAGREGWRMDHIERQAMPELMRVGLEFLSGHVESQGTGARTRRNWAQKNRRPCERGSPASRTTKSTCATTRTWRQAIRSAVALPKELAGSWSRIGLS